MKSISERRRSLAETDAILKFHGLETTATFIDDTYCLGVYSDPKAYTKRAKVEIKKIEKVILELARNSGIIKSNAVNNGRHIANLGDILVKVDGHHWRVERIVEDSNWTDAALC